MIAQAQRFRPTTAVTFVGLSDQEIRKEIEYTIITFLKWKERLVAHPDIMGGAVTFPNSRLTVRHVGGMLERGVDPQEILEDYPYLNLMDLEFARLFVRAYPDHNGTMGQR